MSEKASSLLPAANLSSPTSIQFDLKTPPHSDRTHVINRHKLKVNMSAETKNGLLSPEFSSPNTHSEDRSEKDHIETVNDDLPSDKENIDVTVPHNLSLNNAKKRVLENVNTDIPLKKQKSGKCPDNFILPNPDDMPDVEFFSSEKPPYSYANMIGMALLRAPERRLTLAEIYNWIMEHFKYYKRGESGWQNSIRHNLSLNKAFEKAGKSKDKKGHYWKIVSGCEFTFCNIKESKRNAGFVKKAKSELSDETSLDESEQDVPVLTLIPSTPTRKDSVVFEESPFPARFDMRTPVANTLGSIPELNVQYSSLASHPISLLNSSPMIQESPSAHSINSRLDFTCSFSSSNFEMSPMGPMEPGPLLEPITPQRLQRIQFPSITKQIQNFTSLSSASKVLNHETQKFRTPLIPTTPRLGGSSVKKTWASPSYLDEFYASPIQHPEHLSHSFIQILNHHSNETNSDFGSKYIIGSPSDSKRKQGIGANYSRNQIFGIDICTINTHED